MSVSNFNCCIDKCKTTSFSKMPGVLLHRFPTAQDSALKTKWLKLLKGKCSQIDWRKSRICSIHFERNCFNSSKQLLGNAVPTIFLRYTDSDESTPQPKFIRMLQNVSDMTTTEIMNDVKRTMSELKRPSNIDDYIMDDLTCRPDAPAEIKIWILLKKQQQLCNILNTSREHQKMHVENVQKTLEEVDSKRKDLAKNMDTYKYIIKCLQEKQAVLEEQIEILAAVESR